MGQSIHPPADPTVDGNGGDRLDSWKEIAAFLHRDVRTVQRWEKQAGLPVRRHAQSRLRTAYAYRSELDAWWQTQRAVVDHDPSGESAVSGTGRLPRRVVIAGALVIIVSAAALGGRILTKPVGEAGSASTPPVAVLVTRFDDHAGDPSLATLLEESLARALARHPSLEAVSSVRVHRTLQLMRLDGSTPLTPSVGREVALRDGSIAWVLTGRLHRLESRYFLDLEATEPSDGRVRVSLERKGGSREELLANVDEEAARLVANVVAAGKTARSPGETLERVTTSSLSALRLYTAAVRAGERRQWHAAELLGRRAIAADEHFASALALVGWAMRQQGRPVRDCLPLLARAVELSSRTTDQESYLISGASHSVSGNDSAAVGAYEALFRLQPRDRPTLDLLIDAYSRVGRVKDAVELAVSRAESEPNDFYANVRCAHALTVWQGDRDRASTFVRKAQQLASHDARVERPVWDAWLTVLPVFQQWMADDSRAGLETLGPLDATLNARLGRERDAFATMVGASYLAFGRVRQAEHAFRQAASPVRQMGLATLALLQGNERLARNWLQQVAENSAARPALFARVGLLREAENGLDASFSSEYRRGMTEATRGLIAVKKGHTEDATQSLRRASELLRFSGEPEYFLAVDALARISVERGDIDHAIRLLNDAASQRSRTYGAGHWTGAHWLKLNADLVALYRQDRRHEEADRLSATLRKLLSHADTEHPIVRMVTPAGPR